MNILLINPINDLAAVLGNGRLFVPSLEPLGILYLAAVCREAGYGVSVIDACAEQLTPDQLTNRIREQRPDIIGLTSFTSNGEFLYGFGKRLKREFPEAMIVFGNTHAGMYAKHYLEQGCCDAVVHGEGEYVFLELVRAREERRDLKDVPSLSFLKDNRAVTTSPPAVMQDISGLPFPARDLVKKELYGIGTMSNFRLSVPRKHEISRHLFTSRGCSNRCSFCAVHHNSVQRFAAPQRAVDEMEMLVRDYKAEYLFFMDSVFNCNREHVMSVCSEIKKRGLSFRWGCEMHVNHVDREVLREMESAGCADMNFGIESGVQRLLDSVSKGTTLERIERAIKLAKTATKANVMGMFILGLPGETPDETLRTIRFAKRLPLDMAQFSIFTPFPGSRLYDALDKSGVLDTGIRSDGTLDTGVWKRYSPYVGYTHNDPVWVSEEQTGKGLRKLQRRALREFYFRPRQFWLQARRVRWSTIRTTLKAFRHTFLAA